MKNFLMCSPDHFGVTYNINPWMSTNIGNVDHAMAYKQWDKLHNSLSKISHVNVLPGVKNLPDLVFTANAGIVKNNTAVVSLFRNSERQPEEQYFKDWFKKHHYITFQLTDYYEGEGDHLVDKWGRNWMGSGFRTASVSAKELTKILCSKVVPLELVDHRWYHLDTCFCPLPNGELMWYPNAFSAVSQDIIRKAFSKTIEVSTQDALAFCCNSVVVDDTIFIPTNLYAGSELTKLGYKVESFELTEFLKAGGAAKCLVLNCGESE